MGRSGGSIPSGLGGGGGGVQGRLNWPGSKQGQTHGPGVRIDLNGNLYVNDTEDQVDTEEEDAGWDANRWPDSEPQDDDEDPSLFPTDSVDVAMKFGDSFVPETQYEDVQEEAVVMEERVAKLEQEEAVVMLERVAKVEHEDAVVMEEPVAKVKQEGEVKEEQVGMEERPLAKLQHAAAMEEQAVAMVEYATTMEEQATAMVKQA